MAAPPQTRPLGRYLSICQAAYVKVEQAACAKVEQADENVIASSAVSHLAKATYHGEPPRFVGLRYDSLGAAKAHRNGGMGAAFNESLAEHAAALRAHADLVYPKHQGPVWVYGCSSNGGRGDVDATHLTTLFLDADGVGDWHHLLEALAQAKLTFIAQRSGGHTDDNPKWHVAIPIQQTEIPRLNSGLPDKVTWQSAYAWIVGVLSGIAKLSSHFDLAISQAFLHVVYPGARRTPEAAPPETICHEGGILDLTAFLRLTGFNTHMAELRAQATPDPTTQETATNGPTTGADGNPNHNPQPQAKDATQGFPGPKSGQPGQPIRQPNQAPPGQPRSFTPAEVAEGRKRAIAYAVKLDPSWSEHGGDQALWEAALKVRRGFPLATPSNQAKPDEANRQAATILLQHFNPRCVNRDGKTPYPWDKEVIARKVREAATAHLGGKQDYWLFDEPSRNDVAATMKKPTPTKTRPTLTVVKGDKQDETFGPSVGSSANLPASEDGWIADIVYHRGKDDPEPKAIFANAALILANDPRWKGVLVYDEMTSRIEKAAPPPWTPEMMPDTIEELKGKWVDGDVNRLQTWFTRAWRLHVSKEVAFDAAERVAERNKRNVVKSYLMSVEWDGVKRVDNWLTTYMGVVSSPYSRMVGQMWLISAVARIFQPGCMAKYSLVLEGPQDIGKSKATRILGGAWWRDMSLHVLKDKDAYIGLRGSWIIELAELDGLHKHESSRVKHYLSQVVDKYRPPYGKSDIEVPRNNVFVGTVNPNSSRGYLNDPTGNVRFWPAYCTRIDDAGLARDRDQLWAEAVSLYNGGARWWPETAEENAMCRVEQAERSDTDDREPIIASWLGSDHARQLEAERGIFGADVIQYALGLSQSDRMDKRIQTDVGHIMLKLGWAGDSRSGKQYCKNCNAVSGKGKTCTSCGGTTFYRPKIYRRQNL